MTEVLVRQAIEDDDLEALLRLYVELHEFHARRLPDRLRIPAVYDDAEVRAAIAGIVQNGDAALFVLEDAGTLVGLAEVYLRNDEAHPQTVAYTHGYLQSLVVLPSFRKQGLGKLLTAAAERWTQEHGGTELRLSVWEFDEGPLPFYESIGYRTYKRWVVKSL